MFNNRQMAKNVMEDVSFCTLELSKLKTHINQKDKQCRGKVTFNRQDHARDF